MRQRRAAMSMAIWSPKAGTTTITLFSICFQTVRPPIYLFELLTQAVPTWEDAVYPWPFNRGIKQTPREHECQRRGIFDVGDHMQTAASYADHYAWKSAPGSMAHQWAHERRAAQ